MANKQIMECVAAEPREVPGFGIFEPGQKTDYNEDLFKSGIFEIKDKAVDKKEVK